MLKCPVCDRSYNSWHTCNYPGCHDGRLPPVREDGKTDSYFTEGEMHEHASSHKANKRS